MAKKSKPKSQSPIQQKTSPSLQKVGPDLVSLGNLLELLKKHDVCEFEWEDDSAAVRLKTQNAMKPTAGYSPVVQQTSEVRGENALFSAVTSVELPGGPKLAESGLKAVQGNHKQVLSPFVGTFYRSGAPNADPYVTEGQSIKKGEVLCIIEAMKLMNEIESEMSGRIVSVLAENGQPVEFGEPLFLVEV